MGQRVEKDGYTAEMTDDLEIVYRNPRGRQLKQFPTQLAGARGLGALFSTHKQLRQQDEACRTRARRWAEAGVSVPRALADADPQWRKALEDEGVPLTEELGEGGLFARTYTGFDGRTLTQLLPEELIPYRDLLMRAEHWETDGLFSTGIPDPSDGELPFPERIIAAHPGQEDLAVRTIRDLQNTTGDWAYIGKKDVDAVLRGLEGAAPALLVTLLDEMADLALREEDDPTAAAWFGRARKTARLQGDKADKEWLRERYLAYAAGKALSATALRDWARELAVKGVATEADLTAFREVALRRVRASREAYPQLAADVRKIAKAAGLDPERELAVLLQEIFAAGGVSLSDEKFWTDCLKGRAFDLLGDHAPEAARQMLKVRPRSSGDSQEVWPRLLERTGALALLTGKTPGLAAGEAAAWLSGCALSSSGWRKAPWPVLYDLAEKIAPKLAADGVPVAFRFWRMDERNDKLTPLDLIDVLLEHGAPVADPPEALALSRLNHLTADRRPKLAYLWADERFARELRARLRADLEMTTEDGASNSWYQPHETKGWGRIPDLFDNPVGHEELRAWCDRERAKLRRGVDLGELVLLLGRFVHVGAAVDLALKDAEAAQEFAAVDVLPLVMAEMPEGVSRAQVVAVLEKLRPTYVLHDQVSGRNSKVIPEALPQLAGPTGRKAAAALVKAVNCRAGLELLVRRFTPAEEGAEEKPKQTPAPVARQEDPQTRVSRRLTELAESSAPVWDGDLASPSAEFECLYGLHGFRRTHADAAALALHAVSASGYGSTAVRAGRSLLEYAAHPVVSGAPGRWRFVDCELPEGIPQDPPDARVVTCGTAFKTATSVAYELGANGLGRSRTLWEYAPDGVFCEDGPLAAAGAVLTRSYVPEPVRPGGWFVRFAELYRRRGPAPVRLGLAAAFAERLGLTAAEATVLLTAYVPAAPHETAELSDYDPGSYYALASWKIREAEAERAVAGLTSALGPALVATLYDKLLPDDPERLWTTGPDVDRAAEWWRRELGRPLPVPVGLLPLAAKETLPPKGEPARSQQPGEAACWPSLRLPALTGRIATGADCLAPDPSGLAGEPQLLALPRVAAWLAYRTPAGDPLRPAIGAAISRLRAELASGPGPLTLFSLQSNYLMGDAPSTGALTSHPAVTEVYDPAYFMRNMRVDPAALKGPDDPLLASLDTYLDSPLPSQWLPSPSGLPAVADLRLLLSDDFAALGAHLATDDGRTPGWEQHPVRSVPHLIEACAKTCGLGEDPAALYLMLLALPDPTDRNVRTWTAWSPARFKAAVAELAASGLVVRGDRPRAGRSLFLPGTWQERKSPRLPIETTKLGLLPLAREHRSTSHMAAVPSGPLPALFERAWEGRTG
ncbi:hypothetical protein [Streptomyces chattanoogensis]|uniref:hypothetical protein n=1 Tax=Streptomyces chattanoogensis TaxID=66876 RepID=UPI00368D28FE